MSEVIRLSKLVKHRLEKYRDNHDHGSMDSAVRELMLKADIDIYEYQDEMEDDDESDSAEADDDGSDLAETFGWEN